MPVTAFNSHTDGLDPSLRRREHFNTNTDLDDDRLWVAYAEVFGFNRVPMMVEGGLIYLDKPTNGGFAAYEDGFTLLELSRKHYREAGLGVRKLDALIR